MRSAADKNVDEFPRMQTAKVLPLRARSVTLYLAQAFTSRKTNRLPVPLRLVFAIGAIELPRLGWDRLAHLPMSGIVPRRTDHRRFGSRSSA